LYDLAKQVGEIEVYPRTDAITGEKTRAVTLTLKRGMPSAFDFGVDKNGVIDNSTEAGYRGKPLSEVVGKDLADKIMSSDKQTLSGNDLRIHPEWAINLYDKRVPSILRDLVKKNKWNTQLEEIDIGAENGNNLTMKITPEMREQVKTEGMALFEPQARYGAAPAFNVGDTVIHKASGSDVKIIDEKDSDIDRDFKGKLLKTPEKFHEYKIKFFDTGETQWIEPQYLQGKETTKEIAQRDLFGGEKKLSDIEKENEARAQRAEIKTKSEATKGGQADLGGLGLFENQDMHGSQQTLFEQNGQYVPLDKPEDLGYTQKDLEIVHGSMDAVREADKAVQLDLFAIEQAWEGKDAEPPSNILGEVSGREGVDGTQQPLDEGASQNKTEQADPRSPIATTDDDLRRGPRTDLDRRPAVAGPDGSAGLRVRGAGGVLQLGPNGIQGSSGAVGNVQQENSGVREPVREGGEKVSAQEKNIEGVGPAKKSVIGVEWNNFKRISFEGHTVQSPREVADREK
jgi:hypothetical protein